jgi:hypothetical protein
MSRPPDQDDAARLERLERETERLSGLLTRARSEVRALQWLVAGVTILAAGALVYLHESGDLKIPGLDRGPQKTVESREFGLINRRGNRVLLTDDDKFGYPNLVFMDLEKHYKMGIKVWPEGGGTPGMVFYDDTGIRGNWRMDEDNGTVLNLMGRGKAGRITLAVSKDGEPSVAVVDKQGKVLFEVPQGAARKATAEPAATGTGRGNPASAGRPDDEGP